MTVTNESNEYSISQLPPKLKEFVKRAQVIHRLRDDFCFRDFPELTHGAFRQNVSRLRKLGLIVTTVKSWFSYYKIKGEHTGRTRRTVTNEGMGVGTNMQEIINEASTQIPTMHDIKIKFSSNQLYKNAVKQGMIPNKQNKGIFLETITLSRDVYAKVAIYPTTVSIDIGCTWEPIIYDIRGTQELIGHLNLLHYYLYSTFHTHDVPESLDWIVTHYHLNQDGQTEFTGKPFERTFSDIVGGFSRMYTKRFPDGTHRIRSERIFTPNTSVKNQIEDMQNVGKFIHSDKRDISNIMPSQILSLNHFVESFEKMQSMYNSMHSGATFI